MLPFISLLPIFIYLLVLKLLDSFSLAKWKLLGLCTAVGIASCVLAILNAKLLHISAIAYNVVAEEVLKAAFMVFIIKTKRIRFLAECLIYGAAVGGGFALLENIVYLSYNPEMYLGTAIFRGFGVAIMHMGTTGLVATMIHLTLRNKPSGLWVALSFLPSVLIHSIHNTVSLQPIVQLAATIAIFFVLFVLIFNLGEKKIYKWMDHSISVDIQTLSDIKNGNFSSTKAGQYLLSVKQRFNPEVFFDIICMVEIYYEMTIEKQSQMLLQQAGFGEELTPEQKTLQENKIKEFKALKKRIGKSGLWILKPIIDP